jgi:flagellar P-ring protein precursor FlgI
MKTNRSAILLLCSACLLAISTIPVHAQTRLKDIAGIQGVRGNQLVGYGLVVGLAGTGDSQQVAFTLQSVAAMLQKFGITVPQSSLRLKNVAAVMVTADLPAFAHSGDTIDVTVSSLGDASSLSGGTLIQTPLQAANGQVYAAAQGSVTVGGFSVASSGGGSSVSQNQVTTGRVPSGAIVEQDVPTTLAGNGNLSISLNEADYTTAERVADSINKATLPGAGTAIAVDGGTITVATTKDTNIVKLIAELQDVTVTPDASAKIVINERTGTVVLGGMVTISSCAIAHGNLTIEITNDAVVSQPAPLSNGTTVTVPKSTIKVGQGSAHLALIKSSPTIDKVVKALNALGVKPLDLISILQAMKGAGALNAEIEIQ